MKLAKKNKNYDNHKKISCIYLFGLLVMVVMTFFCKQSIWAYENGAYLVSRTTSYVNPETGKTEDGGSNIALGESMCASIVDSNVLVEVVDGRTYVTLGIGLMSNISDINIAVQSSTGGAYQNVPTTVTGSCVRDGDTCNHYRFEVVSPELYIRPTFYVTPMGRNVTFFIKLNMASITSGTGNFKSEMVPQNVTQPTKTEEVIEQVNTEPASEPKPAPEPAEDKISESTSDADTKEQSENVIQETQEEVTVSSQTVDADELIDNAEGLHIHEVESQNSSLQKNQTNQNNIFAVIGFVLLLLAILGIVIWIRMRKEKK